MYLGGGRRRHEDTVETLFPVIFLGRAAENNVGQEARVHDMSGPASKKVGPRDRVHDMREMRRPYDQSCILGRPARKEGEGFVSTT